VISIDNDEPNNLDVKQIAEEFQWLHGNKDVRYQSRRLGLRNHILQCAGLSQEYGSVIILEDDLYVSPWFYDFASAALDHYAGEERVGGISLYNQPLQEIVQYPFRALYDNSDVYFMQFPSSLGQAWTADQWKKFREWYDTDPDLTQIPIPDYILNWPPTSWKRFFVAYLVLTDKYFVFPRYSLTTNFNDPGTNLIKKVNHEGQAPLRLVGGPYRFISLEDSGSMYDVNLELKPGCVRKYSSHLDQYDFELDLYGTKDLHKIKSAYLVTSRPSANPVMGFKRALKPHEMNVICNLEGKDFSLSRTEDIRPVANKFDETIANYKYFYTRNPIGWKAQAYNYYTRLRNRFIRQR